MVFIGLLWVWEVSQRGHLFINGFDPPYLSSLKHTMLILEDMPVLACDERTELVPKLRVLSVEGCWTSNQNDRRGVGIGQQRVFPL